MKKINVTKSFLPPIEEYNSYVNEIWKNGQLTNQGPLLRQLETALKSRLGAENFHFVTNGTIALQISLRALGVTEGEIITTPFSYVATTSAILWERCAPVFVDILPDTLCIDPAKIESAITDKTKAILAVHVFGNACDVEAIEEIAKRHNIKVIYDAAHAFGVNYKGKSLLTYGDASICSFHATKLFHTIEGGSVIAKEKSVSDNIELIKRFGHHGDDHQMLGINGKSSEFQAAMGLCNLNYIDEIIRQRKRTSELYDQKLAHKFIRPIISEGVTYNYAYYPVIFNREEDALEAIRKLNLENISPRRYFYPSLNTLPYLEKYTECPVSEDISKRILCLPLYYGIDDQIVNKISEVLLHE